MFRRTLFRLTGLYSTLIAFILLVMVLLFYFSLTNMAAREERERLSLVLNKAVAGWTHGLSDGRTDDRDHALPHQDRTEWLHHMEKDLILPQQILLVSDDKGTEFASDWPDPAQSAIANRVRSGLTKGQLTKIKIDHAALAGDAKNPEDVQGDYRTIALLSTTFPAKPGEPETGADSAVLIVGEDVTESERLVRGMQAVLIGTAGVLLLVAAGAGYALASRAMVPITSAFRRQQQFTADASHELRTPLAVLKSSVEILEDERDALSEFHRGVLSGMGEEIVRMTSLTERLLTLARQDSERNGLQKVPLDLLELAGDTMNSLKPLALQAGLTLSADWEPEGTIRVVGDALALRQLFLILLDNAIKYTPSGGTVRMRVTKPDGRTARIHIEDTGIGIPEDDLPHIFERFYRVDKARSREQGGAGLGLSIAAAIAAEHGGTLAAESRYGQGSVFHITLPAAPTKPN